jgi:hypothetical protein
MIIYELLVLKRPYSEFMSTFEISQRIIRGERPELPLLRRQYQPYTDLYLLCTNHKPHDRPSIAEVKALVAKLPRTKDQALKLLEDAHTITSFLSERKFSDLSDSYTLHRRVTISDTVPCTDTSVDTDSEEEFDEDDVPQAQLEPATQPKAPPLIRLHSTIA